MFDYFYESYDFWVSKLLFLFIISTKWRYTSYLQTNTGNTTTNMWPLCDFEMSQKYETKQKNFVCYWNWIFSMSLTNTISNSIMHCTVDCRGKKGSHLSLITSSIEMHIKMNLLKNCTGWSIMASEGLPLLNFQNYTGLVWQLLFR